MLNEIILQFLMENLFMNSGQFKKGGIPWNKGLTKDTDSRLVVSEETRKKHSDFHKNQERSPEWCKHISEAKKGKPQLKLRGKKRPKEVGEKISAVKKGHLVSEETRAKISASKTGKKMKKDVLKMKLSKEYLTRKKNNSFNTSKPENDLYEQLLRENENKTIYRNYKDADRYPFYCDFYIVEDDLFIELNAHWTHGGKPFDASDPECLSKLSEWVEKSKTSKFYENAIQTWTVRDVEKRKCAEKNKLNYKVVY